MDTFPCRFCEMDCYDGGGVVLLVGAHRDADLCDEAPVREDSGWPGFHEMKASQ